MNKNIVATGVGVAAVAFLLAVQPWLAAGAVFGALLLWITINWPLAVVGFSIATGPFDFSFLTGGYKSLLPAMGGLDMNGIRLVGISAGLSLVILLDRRMLRGLLNRNVVWYLVFLGYALATVAHSLAPMEGLRLFFKLAYPLLIFLIVSSPDRKPEEVDRLVDWMLFGALFVLIINPILVVEGGFNIDRSGQFRVRGVGLHANPFSFYLLAVILVCVTRFSTRGFQRRYLFLAAGAGVWMMLTFTRVTVGAALAGLGGMVVYSALVNKRYKMAAWTGFIAFLIAAALTPTALERTFGHIPSPGELWSLVGNPTALYHSVNWEGREMFWALLAVAWMNKPLFGLGLGSSSALIERNFPPEAGLVAHNEYIRLGTDTGFVGDALFFWAVFQWLRTALEVGRTKAPRVQEFALPAMASIIAWAVIAGTDNAFDYYTPFTQYIGLLMGGAVVAARSVAPGAEAVVPVSEEAVPGALPLPG